MPNPAPIPPRRRQSYGFTKCIYCGKIFPKTKPWSKFCIPKHRDAWHNDVRAIKANEQEELEKVLRKLNESEGLDRTKGEVPGRFQKE